MKQCPQCRTGCIDEARFCPRCGGDVSSVEPQAGDPFVGITVAGQFVLRELVGEGGMGRVYRAEQLPIGRTVGVKILHQHLIGDATAAARFQTEARAASRLNHPNVISVFDFGRTETGLIYLAMEFLVGQSLDRMLRAEGPLAFGRTIDITVQVLHALEAAHELGIIHRDLKPENVFLEPRSGGGDLVKVLDFGIAKFRGETAGVTQAGMVAGTPEYMSPEQARGDPLDARSDLYSVGVILYQMLTEQLPFVGKNAMDVMIKHVDEAPIPPSDRCPDREIPASLDDIVMRILSKRRDRRVASAKELGERLVAWAASMPVEVLATRQHPSGPVKHVLPTSSAWMNPASDRPDLPRRTELKVDTVGRTGERRMLTRLLRDGAGGLWISGPRGIGKTRLCQDFEREAAQAGVATYWARPDPTRARDPLWGLRAMICEMLGIAAPSGGREGLVEVLLGAGLPETEMTGLQELFGLNDGSDLPAAVRWRELVFAMRAVVASAGARKPALVILDALDRQDGAVRRIAEELLRAAVSLGVIVVATAADSLPPPEGIESRVIAPLDREASLSLAMNVVSVDRTEDLVAAAAGHPLWMLHLAAVVSAGGLTRAGRLVDVLAARLETLEAQEREALQWLAVCGDEADMAMLQALAGREDLVNRMRPLVERGLVVPLDDHGYRFRDSLLGEVAQASLPAEVGRQLHHKCFDATDKNRPVLRAHHAWLGDLGFAAIEAADSAGCWAAGRLDEECAALWFHRGQELVRRELGRGRVGQDVLNSVAIGLARKEAEVLRRRGDRMAADGVLLEALNTGSDRPVDRIRLRADLAQLALEAGSGDRALSRIKEARAEMQRTEVADWLAGTVLRTTSAALLRIGDFDGARAALDEALRRAVVPGGKDAPWEVLLELAEAYLAAGQLEQGQVLLERALAAAELHASAGGELRTLEMLAEVASQQGKPECASLFERALEMARRVGDRSRQASLLVRTGRAYDRFGQKTEKAATYWAEAEELADHIGLAELARTAKAELNRAMQRTDMRH